MFQEQIFCTSHSRINVDDPAPNIDGYNLSVPHPWAPTQDEDSVDEWLQVRYERHTCQFSISSKACGISEWSVYLMQRRGSGNWIDCYGWNTDFWLQKQKGSLEVLKQYLALIKSFHNNDCEEVKGNLQDIMKDSFKHTQGKNILPSKKTYIRCILESRQILSTFSVERSYGV